MMPAFDASKPPPPILTTLKRPCSDDVAAANKKGRFEDCNAANAQCDQCLQREQRICTYEEDINKYAAAEEDEVLRYKKVMEDCESKKELLSLLINLEDCVETRSHLRQFEELQELSTLPQPSRTPHYQSQERISIKSILEELNIPGIDTSQPATSGIDVSNISPPAEGEALYTDPGFTCPRVHLGTRTHSPASYTTISPVYNHTMPPPPILGGTQTDNDSQYICPSTLTNARTDVLAANVSSAPPQTNNTKNYQSYAPDRYGPHYYQPY